MAQALQAEMDDMVGHKIPCRQGIATDGFVIGMTTAPCARPRLVVLLEARGQETGVATDMKAGIVVDHERHLADTGARHQDATPMMNLASLAGHSTKYLTYRSLYSTKDFLGEYLNILKHHFTG